MKDFSENDFEILSGQKFGIKNIISGNINSIPPKYSECSRTSLTAPNPHLKAVNSQFSLNIGKKHTRNTITQ